MEEPKSRFYRKRPLIFALAAVLVLVAAGCAASDAISSASVSEEGTGDLTVSLSTDAGMDKGPVEGVPDEDVVAPGEAYNLLNATQASIVDVREYVDSGASSIPGASNIPAAQLSIRTREIAADKPVIVAGYDSESAVESYELLRDAGFDVRVMYGGMQAWMDAGLRTVNFRALAKTC